MPSQPKPHPHPLAPHPVPSDEPSDDVAPMDDGIVDRLARLLSECQREGFFGDVVVKLRAGQVSSITLMQVIKPEEL